jgi:pimeloyl-ACP methyl ester carboxylesterase
MRGLVLLGTPVYMSLAEARVTLAHGSLPAGMMLRTPLMARIVCERVAGEAGPARRLYAAPRLHALVGQAMLRTNGPRAVVGMPDTAGQAEVWTRLVDGLADTWLHSWEPIYRSLLRIVAEHNAWPDLDDVRRIGIPLLLLSGDADAVAPIWRTREVASYGGWPLHEVAGAAHSVYLTHAPKVGEQVARFIEGHEMRTDDMRTDDMPAADVTAAG